MAVQPELSLGNPSEVMTNVAHRHGVDNLRFWDSATNHVGLGDERLVIKVSKSAKSMGGLAVEAAALDLLGRSGSFPVTLPKVVEFSTNPAFLVTTYIPGKIVEASTLHEISLKDREVLGHDIGMFVLSLAQQVDVATARNEVPPLGEDDTWESLFGAVESFSSAAFPSLSKLAKKLYPQWISYQADETDSQFMQGDLRLGNMAVSESNRLNGVFDFGRAGIGNASGEVSPLVNLDPAITQGAVDELRAASIDIDVEQMHVWDEMKKLLRLAYHISSHESEYPKDPPIAVRRACRILSSRHPEFEWSELEQLHP